MLRKVWQLLDGEGRMLFQDRIYTKVLAYAKKHQLRGYEIVSAYEEVTNDPQ